MQLPMVLLRALNLGLDRDIQRLGGFPLGTGPILANLGQYFQGVPQLFTLFIEHQRGLISPRRLQLLACAICNSFWDLSVDPKLMKLIQACEDRIDGIIDSEIPSMMADQLLEEHGKFCTSNSLIPEGYQALAALGKGEYIQSLLTTLNLGTKKDGLLDIYNELTEGFLNPIVLENEWLEWNGGLTKQIAGMIYKERRFDFMPVLADALEEAGCREPRLLEHCRSDKPHFRGCWVLDLLLNQN